MSKSTQFRHFFYALALLVFVLGGLDTMAQKKEYNRYFCSDNSNWSDGKRVSLRDLRETTIAGGSLNIDGKRNGGITVRGENRADVLVRACVQAWAPTDAEAKSLLDSIRVETAGSIRAESSTSETSWSVSYDVLVPRNTNLNLTTQNGGIVIDNVDGTIEFDAKNGGINLRNLSGDVKGRTTNGGVIVDLSGATWKGNGLNVQTTNGGVKVSMPENYAARFETKTVNGGFKSEIVGLQEEKSKDDYGYRRSGVDVSRDLNGGGPLVRVVTTNGGVKIETN